MTERDFDPLLDCYLSWEACIAEFRRQHEAGEPAKERFTEAHRKQRANRQWEGTHAAD